MTIEIDVPLRKADHEINNVRPPIERFSIDYDMEMKLACLLVDRHGNEAQTETNIEMMIKYLESVWYKSRMGEYVQ